MNQESATSAASASKRPASRKPDWSNSDRSISIWVEQIGGGKSVAKIARTDKSNGTKEYLKAYTSYNGVNLAAEDIGSMLEGNSIFSESMKKRAGDGSYKGFICFDEISEVPWKANPARSDKMVNFATVLPRFRKNTSDLIGYLYDQKMFFATLKSGDNVVGELEPRHVVRLVKEKGVSLRFGDTSVSLDHYDPPEGEYSNETARLSIRKGEALKTLVGAQTQDEQLSTSEESARTPIKP